MDHHLVVDEKNQLQELRPSPQPQPKWLKILAKIISYIFHPVFIPVYVSVFLINLQPYLYSGIDPLERKMMIPRFIVIYTFFPLVSVLLLRGLNFIESIQLKTQRDRIIPYIICMIYYFGIWYFIKRADATPHYFIVFTLATFLGCIGGFFANIFIKVSMHAIAAGLMSAFIILVGLNQDFNFGLYISIAVLLTGIICTARFVDSDLHRTFYRQRPLAAGNLWRTGDRHRFAVACSKFFLK
jgi:hypothetical protein